MINIIYTVLCIICLCLGFFVGYLINKPKKEEKKKKKKVVVKMMEPVERFKKHRENKKYEELATKEMEKYSTILDNINNYDGTSKNQREVK